ncbi:MAG: type 1 glutamine amidotransferase domain-containing protein [Nannocystaceae bacterium]
MTQSVTQTQTKTVLVVASSHPELAGEANGTYLPELTHALHVLDERGLAWELASPAGGAIPHYGDDADALTRSMLADPAFAARLAATARLADVDPARYDAVFYPGGYGLLFDLVDDAHSHRILASFHGRGLPIAAVCHGPAALARVELEGGAGLVEGRHLTGFTREEEAAMSTLETVPVLLEALMLERGAIYRKKAAWKVLVVEDGALITGQNPASAQAVGEALARRLLD